MAELDREVPLGLGKTYRVPLTGDHFQAFAW